MYKQIVRPILFRFHPEAIHQFTMLGLKILHRIPLFSSLIRFLYRYDSPSLQRELFGLRFPSPVGLAAGLDKNAEFYNELSDFGFSFVEVGSLTPKPQDGNPRPRLFRLPKDKAIINRMGINNKGIDYAIRNIQQAPPRCILVGNIAKNTTSLTDEEAISDYEHAFTRMYDFVDLFTLNVSCPNVEGLQSLQDISFLSDIVDPILAHRMAYDTYKPILVKISPDLPFEQVDDILDYCMLSGVDGIVAGNTTRRREGLQTPQHRLEQIGRGGLSGAPLYEKTLALVRHIHNHTKGRLPIVGVGGIMTPGQALELLHAGASLLEIYTGFIYNGPRFIRTINKYLEKHWEK